MKKHVLFVHIPKTAGTSFRVAAEKYFGQDNTFYDYSSNALETSAEILEKVYNKNDLYALYTFLNQHPQSFLSGHFNINKYAPLYDALNIVTFVREPVSQVLSHYNHFKNNYGYDKGLLEFAEEKRFRNVQSRNLRTLDVRLYGFIGLTEEYNTSIDLFNTLFNTSLPHMHMNEKSLDSLSVKDIGKEDMEKIKKLNMQDIELYNTVKKQFAVRKQLHKQNLPFTYGFIQKIEKERIVGLAFQRDNDNPIEIDIYAGKTYLKTVQANKLRPGMVAKNLPRKGYVGFDYTYTGDAGIKGKLHAYVKLTGQEIL
jgi:hypothetical protein